MQLGKELLSVSMLVMVSWLELCTCYNSICHCNLRHLLQRNPGQFWHSGTSFHLFRLCWKMAIKTTFVLLGKSGSNQWTIVIHFTTVDAIESGFAP